MTEHLYWIWAIFFIIPLVSIIRRYLRKRNMQNFSLEQLIRLQELVEKKDYGHEKKVGKWKKKLLTDINVEIYKRDDAAIWK